MSSNELEARPERTPVLRKALAGLVLVAAVALGIWVVIGVVKAIFWTVLAVVVVVAILWALKTLFW
jgi:uncharacterized membrane protein